MVCALLRTFACFLFIIGVPFGALMAQKRASDKPNVVIILADDLGYGDVSVNNPMARTKTPNIDRLAQRGIRFTDAHAGGAVCTPSRYGLITGRYFFRAPNQNGRWGYLSPTIEAGRETIGSMMQKAGYTTACIGKWHLGLNWQLKNKTEPQFPDVAALRHTNTDFSAGITGGPNALGFNYAFILPGSLDMPPYVYVKNSAVVDPTIQLTSELYPPGSDEIIYAWDTTYTSSPGDVYRGRGVWWRNGEMSKSFSVENCLDQIVDEGLSFITNHTRNNADKPFMLYLPLTGPHTPWVPNARFKGTSELGMYGDFVSQVDHVVYQVTQTLKELNIEDNTLLIFASDNGAHWSEEDIQQYGHQSNWNRRGQKGDIWDGGHHVPLLVKWPSKIKAPAEYHGVVSLVDVMATLADMTGQQIDERFAEDSFSFWNVLNGNYTHPVREHIIYISSTGKLAIQKNGWKLIDGLGSCGFTKPSTVPQIENGPKGQLYHLTKDPLETTNLYLQQPLKVRELSALLHQLKEQGFSHRYKLEKSPIITKP